MAASLSGGRLLMLQPSVPMVAEGWAVSQKTVPCDRPGWRVRRSAACAAQPTSTRAGHGGSRSARQGEPHSTLGRMWTLLNCAAPWRGLMANFAVAAPELPESPSSRRKQKDRKVGLRPTNSRDRSASRRNRSIPIKTTDGDAARALGPTKDERRYVAHGRSADT